MMDSAQQSSAAVCGSVLAQTTKNAVFEAVFAGVILLTSLFWLLGAKFLWWGAAVITALDALHVVGLILSGGVVTVLSQVEGEPDQGGGWLHAATLLRVAGLAVAVAILFWLRGRLW